MQSPNDNETSGLERPLRVLHLITTDLGVGGAEMMLYRLVAESDRRRFQDIVYTMMCADGLIADMIRGLGIEVRSLGMKRGAIEPGAVFRLWRELRSWKPDVIQTWMDHANLLGGVAAKLAGGIPTVWSIHHGDLRSMPGRRLTLQVIQLCARLSSWLPASVVCCAESTRTIHIGMGFSSPRMTVIPNGFDVSLFQPMPEARKVCRERMGIPEDAEAAVVVGRYHPDKDHRNFVAAAKLLHQRFPKVLYLMCGDGINSENAELSDIVAAAGLGGAVRLLGRRTADDVAYLMSRSALTVSSAIEAFPTVIGEAMACGSVCVVTDVGDAARMVGDTGIVVQPGSPAALAEGLAKVFSLSGETRAEMGFNARERIVQHFSIKKIAAMYRDLYLDVAKNGGSSH